jgi:hypothetical protein
VNDQRVKDGSFQNLKNNDKIRFGKENIIYIFEPNQSYLSRNKDNINNTEVIDNTLMFPQSMMLKDDKISLVNEEFYTKATRNHFEKKPTEIRPQINSSPVTPMTPMLTNPSYHISKNQPDGLRLPLIGTESPKFNNSLSENINPQDNNDLNVTFKHNQNNQQYIQNSKSRPNNLLQEGVNANSSSKIYEDLMIKLERLTKENENYEKRILEMESRLLERSNECKKSSNSIEQVTEEYAKLTAIHNALLIYSSDLQKRADLMEIELSNQKSELERYLNIDWGKLLLEKESTIKLLQTDVQYYKQEIAKFKSIHINNSGGKQYSTDMNKRIDSLLETYLNENKKYKKAVILIFNI